MSIIVLALLGQTLNVMTLGGLALAVGILVDDATVEIENIHRNLAQSKPLVQAILDGAQQIAVPAFVSTLCICIVFVPVVFITGAAKSLFTPLAMAVVFAMMTSYSAVAHPGADDGALPARRRGARARRAAGGRVPRFHAAFNRAFSRLQQRYGAVLERAREHRAVRLLRPR